jgi:hypothetical protein
MVILFPFFIIVDTAAGGLKNMFFILMPSARLPKIGGWNVEG